MAPSLHAIVAAGWLTGTSLAKTCCYAAWGDETTCGGFPGGLSGLCNTDWTASCLLDSDCPDSPAPGPTPEPPAPTPPAPPVPTPAPTPGPSPGKLDLVGYYGNAGNAVSQIPKISEIHEAYNIIIVTFAGIDTSGNFDLDLQGPYKGKFDDLGADLKAWKKAADKWGRPRKILLSIGGEKGHWPSNVATEAVLAGFETVRKQFHLDGLDIDIENNLGSVKSLVPVTQNLTGRGMIVTGAPQACSGPLEAYEKVMPHLTWIQPQFYCAPPSCVTIPYIPTDSKRWPKPWMVRTWQDEGSDGSGVAWWADVLSKIGSHNGLKHEQLGMLFPTVGSQIWNAGLLAKQVAHARVTHVGHWALAYDRQMGWKFTKALAKLLGTPAIVV